MKLSIVDSNYAKSEYQSLAASWLRWELRQAGASESPPELADVLLVTCSSQQGISEVRGALKRIGNKRAKVIVGGGASYAPAVFDAVADLICVGEGARFVRTLLQKGWDAVMALPESWIPGDGRPVIPNVDFPWELPPLNHPDGTVRIFASRGCRYKCLFCQTGWETIYRVSPDPERLKANARHLQKAGKRVAFITNDGAEAHVNLAGQSEFLSVRLANLLPLLPITRQTTKSVRIGVEGISERLRSAVGKPVRNVDLLNASFSLLANGVGVRWFFVCGLPGESDSDYAELRWLITELKKLPKGVVMMNFHAFIPQPATPLSVLPLTDDYWERFDECRRWFFHGPGFTRHVQIVAPSQYIGRLKRAQESMAAVESELRRGWWHDDNRNWRVQYQASPAQLRKIATIYARRVGIAPTAAPQGLGASNG